MYCFVEMQFCVLWNSLSARNKIKANFFYVPHRKGGGGIVFGADPVGVGTGVTLPCMRNIS